MRLERAIYQLTILQKPSALIGWRPNDRCILIVTLLYLGILLSLPVANTAIILLFAIYPVVAGNILIGSYGQILRKSLIIIPVLLILGAANPIIDKTPAIMIGKITISEGWISFISIIIRGLLAFQALLILIIVCGFMGVAYSMRRLGVPAIITTQLQLVYRYLSVLLIEAQNMYHARESRGFGQKNIPLSQWGQFIGQLFLRTIKRSERIHSAMLARGFTGTMPEYISICHRWNVSDTMWLVIWSVLFMTLRFANIMSIFNINI